MTLVELLIAVIICLSCGIPLLLARGSAKRERPDSESIRRFFYLRSGGMRWIEFATQNDFMIAERLVSWVRDADKLDEIGYVVIHAVEIGGVAQMRLEDGILLENIDTIRWACISRDRPLRLLISNPHRSPIRGAIMITGPVMNAVRMWSACPA